MMDSRFDTISIPRLTLVDGGEGSATEKRSAALLVGASKHPLRVVVQNISFAAEVYLAYDAATLQTDEPGSNTFMLQAGVSITIMLAPRQTLNAISLSANAQVSLAISEALPIDKM